jgi:acetyl esterase/lipase
MPICDFRRIVLFVFPEIRSMQLSVIALLIGLAATPASAETLSELKQEMDVVYCQIDGQSLQLDAYLQQGTDPHPTVVYVHGGGFVTGDKRPCPSYVLENYSRRGFSVISVNYRLAPQHPFPAAIDDVTAAIAFIKQHAKVWNIDPAQMVLTGESAGGLLSALVGATLEGGNKVAAVIPLFGETDLDLRVSEDPCCMDGHAAPRPEGGCISPGLAAFLGFQQVSTDEQREILRRASTVSHIRRDLAPYLLIHGTRDFGVPFEQSVSLHEAMKKCGADCTLLPVVGGGHGNWSPQQWQEVEAATFGWLEQRLRH